MLPEPEKHETNHSFRLKCLVALGIAATTAVAILYATADTTAKTLLASSVVVSTPFLPEIAAALFVIAALLLVPWLICGCPSDCEDTSPSLRVTTAPTLLVGSGYGYGGTMFRSSVSPTTHGHVGSAGFGSSTSLTHHSHSTGGSSGATTHHH